jgi:hypothetical protein
MQDDHHRPPLRRHRQPPVTLPRKFPWQKGPRANVATPSSQARRCRAAASVGSPPKKILARCPQKGRTSPSEWSPPAPKPDQAQRRSGFPRVEKVSGSWHLFRSMACRQVGDVRRQHRQIGVERPPGPIRRLPTTRPPWAMAGNNVPFFQILVDIKTPTGILF